MVHTNLFQPLKVLPEESHGPVGPRSAQLDNAVLQQLLNVVFLHVLLTFPQAPLFLAARTSRCHDNNRNPAQWPLTFVLRRGTVGGMSNHHYTAWIHFMRREKQRSLSVWWYRAEMCGCEKNRARVTKYCGVRCCELWVLLSVKSEARSYDGIAHNRPQTNGLFQIWELI